MNLKSTWKSWAPEGFIEKRMCGWGGWRDVNERHRETIADYIKVAQIWYIIINRNDWHEYNCYIFLPLKIWLLTYRNIKHGIIHTCKYPEQYQNTPRSNYIIPLTGNRRMPDNLPIVFINAAIIKSFFQLQDIRYSCKLDITNTVFTIETIGT